MMMKVEQYSVNDESGDKPKRVFEDAFETGCHRPQIYVAFIREERFSCRCRSLCASAKLIDLPAIALRGTAHGRGREMHHGFALVGNFGAGFATGVGFTVKRLGDGGGTADIAELKDLNF